MSRLESVTYYRDSDPTTKAYGYRVCTTHPEEPEDDDEDRDDADLLMLEALVSALGGEMDSRHVHGTITAQGLRCLTWLPPQPQPQHLRSEEWRDVVGYEGSYSVSSWGRVRSESRTIPSGRSMRGSRRIRQRILKSCVGNTYPSVGLSLRSVVAKATVHALVAKAFLGPAPEGHEVAHHDGDPTNNRVDNLRWATRVENAADRSRHGTQRRGEAVQVSKLTEADVRSIRVRAAEGAATKQLAAEFGVSGAQIRNIVARRSWAWLDAG